MRAALLLMVVAFAACGSTASKQAEDLQSLAAEGALLAHDARDGDAWRPYTRAHSKELAKEATSLQAAAKTRELSRLARLIAAALDRLAGASSADARVLERRLDEAAKRAEQLA